MNRIKLAAGILALASGEPASAQEGIIVNMWPKTGDWITVLARLPNGGLSCSNVTAPREVGTGEEVSFGFTVTERRTQFYLRVRGARPVHASSLKLESSGSMLVEMPLIQRFDKDGAEVMEADIPDDNFARVVRPNLVKAERVAIRAGDKTYVLPHEQSGKAFENLSACIEDARRRNAGRPR